MGHISYSGVQPYSPVWYQLPAVTFDLFSAAATTKSIAAFSLGAGQILSGVRLVLDTWFLGGAVASATLSLGIAGALDKYASAFDVFRNGGPLVFELVSEFWCENLSAATPVLYTLVTTGANTNALTQGQLTMDYQISTPPA